MFSLREFKEMFHKNTMRLIRRRLSYNSSLNLSPKHNSVRYLTSNDIRETFLKYFIQENGHKFIRSSPVVPFCDPTVAFVNAGMNQFKSVFLGKTRSSAKRVANSQKCVRVGGKHNDLSVVGQDGYHHTFFEMLGNWSFGDYFKKDACRMAWELLCGPYGIDPSRLYVTYFGGDENLNLPPDTECYEIWKSLGVSEDRILPFGSKDNFWEMGATGPCGPCTEIHIDHLPNSQPSQRAKYVNAGREDLTELWNLVFIQFNRHPDGTITPLPEKHIDTGMGFERLTAILQSKSSNYDTDLFTPIFHTIEKTANCTPYSGQFDPTTPKYDLDLGYRILADHSRMITACLSDGMLPDQNHKLRRVLRKSLLLSSHLFGKPNILKSIIPTVVEILGPTYPEMQTNLSKTCEIISHEKELLEVLRKNSAKDFKEVLLLNPKLEALDVLDSPGFAPAFKELLQCKCKFENSTIPGELLYKFRDTYGLDNDAIEKIAEVENLQLDFDGLKKEIQNAKQRTKAVFDSSYVMSSQFDRVVDQCTAKLKDTNDNYKYGYHYNVKESVYEVPSVKAKVLAIISNGHELESIDSSCNDTNICIITDKSNFYCESGGQQYDKGFLRLCGSKENFLFDVVNVRKINGCVVHLGKFNKNQDATNWKINDEVELNVDLRRRTSNILHHTGTHLLNASVRQILNRVIYQTSSSVTADNLKLELGILGTKLELNSITKIEQLVKKVIKSSVSLSVTEIAVEEILKRNDITIVPGEIYPETGLRLLSAKCNELEFESNELCCGTHADNTFQLKEFCITNVKQTGRAKFLFTAIAGNPALMATEAAKSFDCTLDKLEESLKSGSEKIDTIESRLQKVKNELLHGDVTVPYVVKQHCLDRINNLCKKVRETSRSSLKEFVEIEMKNLLEHKPLEKFPYIIYFLKSSTLLESVPLHKATRLCTDRPILVISLTDGMIKARCCVPQSLCTKGFSAEQWLNEFAAIFKAQVSPPKGQNPKEVCNMKAKKIISAIFDEQLDTAFKQANQFAIKNL